MTRRFVAALVLLVLGALLLAELLLSPSSSDRGELAVVLAAPALVAAAAVPWLRRWVSSRTSVAGAALAVGLISLGLGAVTSSAASNAMFLSSHDYRLFLVVLLLSCGLALVVGQQLSQPMADDVRRLGQVATSVADGDLSARTGIERRDEVGQTAHAIDRMVERLADADAERRRLADARQHLLSSVGHDLRTPLAAMRAAVESLQDGIAPDPDRYLGVLAAQLDTVEQLLDDLFQYARIESGATAHQRVRVSLTELADEAVEAVTPLADRTGVRVTLAAEGPGHVDAAPAELSRVLRNLLDNAIRHAGRGGTVDVTVHDTAEAVHVAVTDSGPGFDDAFRAVALEPFTRGDPARGSTGSSGLGLAIARALTEAHGGSIALGPGPGGDVRLTLPPAPAPPARPPAVPTPPLRTEERLP